MESPGRTLDKLTDPDQVLPAIAGPMGLRDVGDRSLLDVLTGVLAGRGMLLVLDNFEHVMAAARTLPHSYGTVRTSA